jgi:hypothetical protein
VAWASFDMTVTGGAHGGPTFGPYRGESGRSRVATPPTPSRPGGARNGLESGHGGTGPATSIPGSAAPSRSERRHDGLAEPFRTGRPAC